jgi:hypothetical protein
MTFEKWMDEVSKAQILRNDDVRNVSFRTLDTFGEDNDEEEPKSPPAKKN